MPYRTLPPKPMEIDLLSMTIIVDTLIGSLSFRHSTPFKYPYEERKKVIDTVLRLLGDTNFSMIQTERRYGQKQQGQAQSKEEAEGTPAEEG